MRIRVGSWTNQAESRMWSELMVAPSRPCNTSHWQRYSVCSKVSGCRWVAKHRPSAGKAGRLCAGLARRDRSVSPLANIHKSVPRSRVGSTHFDQLLSTVLLLSDYASSTSAIPEQAQVLLLLADECQNRTWCHKFNINCYSADSLFIPNSLFAASVLLIIILLFDVV